MRLQRLIMINRAPFEHLEMEFGNENIVLLSGINDAGKTTIISYVVDAFYGRKNLGMLFTCMCETSSR